MGTTIFRQPQYTVGRYYILSITEERFEIYIFRNMKNITDFGLALLAPILPNKDVIGGNLLRDT